MVAVRREQPLGLEINSSVALTESLASMPARRNLKDDRRLLHRWHASLSDTTLPVERTIPAVDKKSLPRRRQWRWPQAGANLLRVLVFVAAHSNACIDWCTGSGTYSCTNGSYMQCAIGLCITVSRVPLPVSQVTAEGPSLRRGSVRPPSR